MRYGFGMDESKRNEKLGIRRAEEERETERSGGKRKREYRQVVALQGQSVVVKNFLAAARTSVRAKARCHFHFFFMAARKNETRDRGTAVDTEHMRTSSLYHRSHLYDSVNSSFKN